MNADSIEEWEKDVDRRARKERIRDYIDFIKMVMLVTMVMSIMALIISGCDRLFTMQKFQCTMCYEDTRRYTVIHRFEGRLICDKCYRSLHDRDRVFLSKGR